MTCKLQPKKVKADPPASEYKSSYYAGYNIDSLAITVIEGNEPTYLEINLTVPYLCVCPACPCDQCPELSVNIEEPCLSLDSDNTCKDELSQCGTPIEDVIFARAKTDDGELCSVPVTQSGDMLTPQIRIPIYAKVDGQYDGDKDLLIQVTYSSHYNKVI